jgi:hypothetical protein
MNKAEEILDNTMRCTIDDDADLDVPENFYFQYNDVLKAMQEYGKYCAEIALDDGFNLGFIENQRPSFRDWWSAFQKKESTK